MTMKLANEMNFEQKVSFALEDLNYFSTSCKIHDASCCHLDFCCIKFFCDELFSYTQKRSPRKEKAVFLDLCTKYSNVFDDIVTAVKNKEFYLEYFKEKKRMKYEKTAVEIEKEIEKFNDSKIIYIFNLLCFLTMLTYVRKLNVKIVSL